MTQVSRTFRQQDAVASRLAGSAADRSLRTPRRQMRSRGRTGLTLLEVIVALALIIMLMGGVYSFYVNTMKARDTAIRSMRDTLLMRALLEQMAEEIRHVTDVVPDNIGFNGSEDELTFVRLTVPDMGAAYAEVDPMSEDPKPGQEDLARVTYKLQWDEEEENMDEDGTPVCYGLLRSQQSPIDPNPSFVLSAEEMARYEEESGFSLEDKAEETPPPVNAELIAPEVKYLKFEYFDGAEWRDTWQSAAQQAAAGADATGGEGDTGSGGEGDGDGSGGDGSSGDGSGGDDSGGDGSGGAGTGGTGSTGDISGLGSGGMGSGGGSGGSGQEGYVLPQAIRITIGKVKVPRREDDFDVSRAAEEEELDKRTYHPDRWTITVYLRQADQSQLSSRKYGIDNDITGEGTQTGEQTEGGGI